MTRHALLLALLSLIPFTASANTATFAVANGCLIAPLQSVVFNGFENSLILVANNTSGQAPTPQNLMRFPVTIRCPVGTSYRFSFDSANGVDATRNNSRMMRQLLPGGGFGPASIHYFLSPRNAASGTTQPSGMTGTGPGVLPHASVPTYTARVGDGNDQTIWIQPLFMGRNQHPVIPLPAGTYQDTLTLALYF
jgi:hypothetical protein